MLLRELLKDIPFISIFGSLDKEIKQVVFDSREVSCDCLFVALKGQRNDGFNYIDEAINRGAIAIISERPVVVKQNGITYLQVKNARETAARVAAAFYHHPAKKLNLIGITGTNGKTTTACLIAGILKEAKKKPGIIGTIFYSYAEKTIPASLTTPDPLELNRLLKDMLEANVTDVVMEVSSHGLFYQRVCGLPFKIAVFTNLSHDHLDFHKNMEEYFQCKKTLFTQHLKRDGYAIINLDDLWGRKLLEEIDSAVLTYGVSSKADVWAEAPVFSVSGVKAIFHTPEGSFNVNSPLIGEPNLLNLLAATAAGIALKIPVNVIQKALSKARTTPGRLERFSAAGIHVFVDYAHTPDALQKTLKTLRSFCTGRLIVVFGCGGDRDKKKRPLMGKIASKMSNEVIITSDNPRSEEPLQIIKEIERGINTNTPYHIVVDRREAIKLAIKKAQPDDIVLVAGKGHEDYQIIGDKKYHLSDREEVEKALRERCAS